MVIPKWVVVTHVDQRNRAENATANYGPRAGHKARSTAHDGRKMYLLGVVLRRRIALTPVIAGAALWLFSPNPSAEASG